MARIIHAHHALPISAVWGESMRLVASLKAGHAAPSAMLRELAAYERQNQLAVALQEVGKVERTLFMLDCSRTRRFGDLARRVSKRASSATR